MKSILKVALLLLLSFCIFSTSIVPTVFSVTQPDEQVLGEYGVQEYEETLYNPNATVESSFSPSSFLVMLTEKASVSLKNYTIEDFPEVALTRIYDLTEYSTASVQKAIKNGEQPKIYHRILELGLKYPSKQAVLDACKILINREDVNCAEPNYTISLNSAATEQPIDIGTNDTYGANQWGLEFANVPSCWNFTSGSPEISVGVIDSGIYSTHTDLANCIDASLSKDFNTDANGEPCNSPLTDENGHGTHIAGKISAVGNNGQGVAGVNWNIKLVSLKVFRGSLGFSDEAIKRIINAIDYAGENNIPILNISSATDLLSSDLNNSLKNAIKEYPGIVICAAGNNNSNTVQYPAGYDLDNVISVGALQRVGSMVERWEQELMSGDGFSQVIPAADNPEGSNYGDWVDIFAPGANIYSTYKDGAYAYMTGTSMATPFVTGVVAMLKSIKPDLTNAQIRNALINGADLFRYPINSDEQSVYSSYKLNAFESLKYVFNNCFTSKNLLYTEETHTQSINSAATIYNAKKALVKLIVSQNYDYEFSASSTNPLAVKLYDSDLSEVSVSTSMSSGGNNVDIFVNLNSGIYYLEVGYTGADVSGEVTMEFSVPPHTHSYDNKYRAYNAYKHKAICICNQSVLAPHVVLQPNPNTCVLCLGTVGTNSNNSIIYNVLNTQVTQNGSYITCDGVVVLNELDVDAYFNGTLTFMPYGFDDV